MLSPDIENSQPARSTALPDSFTLFLQDAGRIPLLTRDEEIMLAREIQKWMEIRDLDAGEDARLRRAQKRGERAYRRFFEANVRLVVLVARKYLRIARELTIDDLCMEGMTGLARAVEMFDPQRGYRFSTYAFNWIRQSVTRAISHYDRSIRLPVNGIDRLSKLQEWAPQFKAEHGRVPSFQEMADFCGCQVVTLKGYLAHSQRVSSLDQVTCLARGGGADLMLRDLIPDENYDFPEVMEQSELRTEVEEVLEGLDFSQQSLIRDYFGFNGPGMSLMELSSDWGLSRSAMAQRKDDAMRQLRTQLLPAWRQLDS